jgi:arginyl-tRNA synthetase
MLRNQIFQIVKKVSPVKKIRFKVERPEIEDYGDYSCNIAFQLSREIRKSPKEIAEELKEKIKKIPQSKSSFKEIKVVNGFLNFYLSDKVLQQEIKKILSGDLAKFPKKKRKVNLEFISANPTGPLHIGNGRGAFWGDVLGNIFKKAGYQTDKEYYINDAKNSAQIKELGKTVLDQGTSYLTPYLKQKIEENKKRIKKNWSFEEAGYFFAQLILRDIKEFVEKELKIKFDNWVSEEKILKKYQKETNKILNSLERKKLIYRKEGALWLKTSLFGDLQDWVLVRKDGTPTYLFSDLIYHYDKIKRGYDIIINIWGADHQAHVKKMEAVMKILGFKGEFKVLISQMVTLKNGKRLSKRRGEFVTLEELLKTVGLDVMRYFYLTKSLDASMSFDLELAKEQSQKNPVFYIQYAYARINSIMIKSKANPGDKILNSKLELLNHPSELKLIKQLIRFPEIIEDITEDYQVHRLTRYTFDLAVAFHKFYQDCRVLSPEKDLLKARLALVLATKIILGECLDLLGISKPRKM